jgi:hypothetical protein
MSSSPRGNSSPRGEIKHHLRTIALIAGGCLGALAAVVAILQFIGVTPASIGYIFPSPARTPWIPVNVYDTSAPSCNLHDSSTTSHLAWLSLVAETRCIDENAATRLQQTNTSRIAAIALEAQGNYRLAADATLTLTVRDLALNACAGVGSRGSLNSERLYAFYSCGDGNWYIVKYSPGSGAPLVLRQSSAGDKDTITPSTTLSATLYGSTLQLVVNNGAAHTASDSEFTTAELIDILCTDESTLETTAPSSNLGAVTISHFRYQAL